MPVKIIREHGSENMRTDANGKSLLPNDYGSQKIILELREKNWNELGVDHAAIICEVEGRRLLPVKTITIERNTEGVFESTDPLVDVIASTRSDYIVIRKHSLRIKNEYAWEEVTLLHLDRLRELPEDLEKYRPAIDAALLRAKDAAQNQLKDTLYFAKKS